MIATAFNTFVLLLSGLFLVIATFKVKAGKISSGKALLLQSILLGAFFVCFQGYEWVRLISYGLTMTSSIFGACFYLLVGTHALHAVVGILALAHYWFWRGDTLDFDLMVGLSVFWLFIVGIWPILYLYVYF